MDVPSFFWRFKLCDKVEGNGGDAHPLQIFSLSFSGMWIVFWLQLHRVSRLNSLKTVWLRGILIVVPKK